MIPDHATQLSCAIGSVALAIGKPSRHEDSRKVKHFLPFTTEDWLPLN
jgi:hypothetical protein